MHCDPGSKSRIFFEGRLIRLSDVFPHQIKPAPGSSSAVPPVLALWGTAPLPLSTGSPRSAPGSGLASRAPQLRAELTGCFCSCSESRFRESKCSMKAFRCFAVLKYLKRKAGLSTTESDIPAANLTISALSTARHRSHCL